MRKHLLNRLTWVEARDISKDLYVGHPDAVIHGADPARR
jgi:hypothetical protein